MQIRLPKSTTVAVCVLLAGCDISSSFEDLKDDTRVQVSGLVVSALDHSAIEGSTIILSVQHLFDERILQETTTSRNGQFLLVGTVHSSICLVNLKVTVSGYFDTMVSKSGVEDFDPDHGWMPRERHDDQPRIRCTDDPQDLLVEMRSE